VTPFSHMPTLKLLDIQSRWLDLVGKPIYGIQHYWVRYEFTPNRGQIHAHLIAISSDNDVLYDATHHAYKMDDGEKLRAEILVQWAEGCFGLTHQGANSSMRSWDRLFFLLAVHFWCTHPSLRP
jgi:hypothetical protein